jgi:DNA repair exonuclease SbcCD ATPase subunit
MKDPNVIDLFHKSIENSEGQLAAMKAMLDQMKSYSDEAKEVREEVIDLSQDMRDTRKEMAQFEKEFRDTNRLLPSEVDDVYTSVVDRSLELAKIRHTESDDNFTKIVGKYRRMIWSKLKKRFGTSKYIHIKRMDYVSSLMFIENFDPEDYI